MAANRRREILRRAAELFAQRGVARTSMEDIANAVGIKREGIYYYFKNRGDILLEIILPQSRSLLMSLQRIMRANTSSVDKLQSALEMHLDAFNPAYIEMIVGLQEQHFEADDARLKEVRQVWADYGRLWSSIVREGQERGEFNPAINPRIAANGLLGMCNWVSRWYNPDKPLTIKDITRTFSIMATTGARAV